MFRPLQAAALCFLLAGVGGGAADDQSFCNSTDLPDPLTLRSDQLTVLINGYSEARLPLLRSLSLSYSSLPFVAAVLILWGNPATPPRKIRSLSDVDSRVRVIRHPSSSLNARFLPRREITTRAVAICDDDVEIDEGSLRFAFEVWGRNRRRIVGFFARSHDLDLAQREWIYTVHPSRYSIMLTKFMILGTEYLSLYSCGGGEGMKMARNFVESERNCEDILMNFVVAKETESGPLLVGGHRVRDLGDVRNEDEGGIPSPKTKNTKKKKMVVSEIGAVGLSAIADHRKRRGECIGEFHRALGAMPLRFSYGKMVRDVGEQGLCKKGGKLVSCDAQ